MRVSAWSLRSLWKKRASRIAVAALALIGLYRLARKPLLLPSPRSYHPGEDR